MKYLCFFNFLISKLIFSSFFIYLSTLIILIKHGPLHFFLELLNFHLYRLTFVHGFLKYLKTDNEKLSPDKLLLLLVTKNILANQCLI